MLQRLAGLPPGIDGARALGPVSQENYLALLGPLVERARREHRGLRFLYELGPELASSEAAAAWEDLRATAQMVRVLEGCAIVSDHTWIREATRLVGGALPCPVRVFGTRERAQAISWLASLGRHARLSPSQGLR